MPEGRPDPDALLAGIQRAEHEITRGKLKIFFGMCPGVGKTFAMLRAAQEKRLAGLRVAIGIVETHGRVETERLLPDIDLIPRKVVDYKETRLEEFDLDRALELRPELILVDELAHTNAPGSRHPKRYQDVKELLHAGIDVYTTMNVQHVESRADLVYQISGVPVRETVPDAFLEYAHQIELIDLSPEDLLRRLQDGKVYLGERAERAAANFFKEEKLTALREMALRFTAEIVDDHLREHMQTKRILGPWNINERLMVALSPSPMSARLIRATRRMAYNLEAPWVALHVDAGEDLTVEAQDNLTRNVQLARELGAEVITTKDRDVAEALQRVAAERNVTQIVMGRPDRRFFRDLWRRGTILDQLVNQTSEVDIHVIRQKRRPIYRGFHPRLPRPGSGVGIYLNTAVYTIVLCAVGYAIREWAGYRAIGFGFLLGILPVSTIAGAGPVLLSAAMSAVLWNYFFIPPLFDFDIQETEDGMMIIAYFAVASVLGLLAARNQRQGLDLRQRESRANILYDFGRQLAEAREPERIAQVGIKSIEAVFRTSVAVFRKSGDGALMAAPIHSTETEVSEKDRAVATWAFENHKKAGWKTDTLSSARCLCLPLRGRTGVIGVALLYPELTRPLTLDQENLIETICGHLATALERESLEADSRKAEILEKSEKLHQALLNSVSHELRTPLTSILGAASTLHDSLTFRDDLLRESLLTDLTNSAERLHHTVDNLLDMSRLSSGVLRLKDELFELNDFIRSTLPRYSRQYGTRRIELDLCEDDLFVRGDEKLLEHVVANLLSNAIRYSPEGSCVTLRSQRSDASCALSVLDEGRGIPPEDLRRVFEPFYRSPDSPPGGVGLGLSIAKSIIEAHRGTIRVALRTDTKGTAFTASLPYQEVPKEVFR